MLDVRRILWLTESCFPRKKVQ